MGSGSGAIAATICNRNFIGIEREKDTYKMAKNWIENFPYETAEKYIKSHASSSEKFKFGQDKRFIMKKD